MAKDPSGAAMNEDSIAFLEDVKKGKPRRFAMICKGTAIVSLIVYKKGSLETHKKTAKESGKGQFYFGVVDGKGQDIRFVLARADGFESEPVKSLVLKNFLDESAGIKSKAYFEVVDALPLVLDADDPLVARFYAQQPAALGLCDIHPDRAAEINELCLQIGNLLNQEQSDQASAMLDRLESLLGSLASDSPKSDAPIKSEPSLEPKLIEDIKRLKPALEKAIATHPDKRAELLGSVAKIQTAIKDKRFTEAQSDLLAIGKTLQSLHTTPPSSPTSSPIDQSAQFLSRLGEIKGRLQQAQALPTAANTNLAELVERMRGAAGKKDYAAALEELSQIELVVGQLMQNGTGIPKGLVAKRQFMVTRWQQLPIEIKPEVEAIKREVAEDMPEVDNAALGQAIDEYLQEFFAQVQEEIDESINAGDSTMLRGLKKRILANELIAELVDNPFTGGDTIRQIIERVLDEVESALAS